MRLEIIFLSLTLVLATSKVVAAPTAEVYPPKPLDTQTSEAFPRQYEENSPNSYYRSSFDFSAYAVGGKLEHNKSTVVAGAARFTKTNYNLDSSSQHFGIDIFSNNLVGWNLGYRSLFTPEEYYEPFWSTEFVGIYSPRDGLGNFIDYRRYFFAAGFGFDDLLSLRRRLHCEMQVRAGAGGVHVFAGATYTIPTDF